MLGLIKTGKCSGDSCGKIFAGHPSVPECAARTAIADSDCGLGLRTRTWDSLIMLQFFKVQKFLRLALLGGAPCLARNGPRSDHFTFNCKLFLDCALTGGLSCTCTCTGTYQVLQLPYNTMSICLDCHNDIMLQYFTLLLPLNKCILVPNMLHFQTIYKYFVTGYTYIVLCNYVGDVMRIMAPTYNILPLLHLQDYITSRSITDERNFSTFPCIINEVIAYTYKMHTKHSNYIQYGFSIIFINCNLIHYATISLNFL